MGLFKALLGEISGKVGGNVFARNRGGSYLRAWAKPINPNTPAQQVIRNAMSNLVVLWGSTLSPGQREDWATYAANVAMTNRLGDTIFLTGQNHYIRSNVPRTLAGLARVDDAPTIFNLGSFAAITTAVVAQISQRIIFDDTEDWASETGSSMILQEGLVQQLTINFYDSPFQFISTIDGNTGVPITSPQIEPLRGFYGAGTRLFTRARITRADGRLSTVQIVQADGA